MSMSKGDMSKVVFQEVGWDLKDIPKGVHKTWVISDGQNKYLGKYTLALSLPFASAPLADPSFATSCLISDATPSTLARAWK